MPPHRRAGAFAGARRAVPKQLAVEGAHAAVYDVEEARRQKEASEKKIAAALSFKAMKAFVTALKPVWMGSKKSAQNLPYGRGKKVEKYQRAHGERWFNKVLLPESARRAA